MAEDSDAMPTCEEAAAVLTGMYHRTECSGSFDNDSKRQRIVFGNDSSIGEHIEESINALSDIFQAYKTKMNNQAQIDSDKLEASAIDAETKFNEAKRASVEHVRGLTERIMTLEGSVRDSESERNRDKLASKKAKVSADKRALAADSQIQAVQNQVDAANNEIKKYLTTIEHERSSLRTEFANEYTAAIKAYQLGADERCHSAASTAIKAAEENCRSVASDAIRLAKNNVNTIIARSKFDSEKARTELQIARQSIASLNFTIAQKNEEIEQLKVTIFYSCGRPVARPKEVASLTGPRQVPE